MGVDFSEGDDVISNINITPFVDIILVVLIIFMVTATTIVRQSILVKLPEASTGESPGSTSLGLTLTEDGDLLLDGQHVSTDELEAKIHDAVEHNDKVVCLIAADEMVAHGRVVWLMDLVKSEGVTSFAINIDPTAALPPDPASLGKGDADAPAEPSTAAAPAPSPSSP